MLIVEAFICGFKDWMDIWGDPLVTGSIFMISYGLTAFLIFRAARGFQTTELRFWRGCGYFFAFQVLNTNLDLHALIWTTGRCLSHAQGWYASRREVQVLVLLVAALLVALVLLAIILVFYKNIVRNMLLTIGVTIALGFTFVKGVNFHWFEHYYNHQIGPFVVADLIEFSGIALAFIAASRRLRKE